MVVELWPYIHKLTSEERMDGRTDKHDVYRTITFNRSCNVLNRSEKTKNQTQKKTKKNNNNKKQKQKKNTKNNNKQTKIYSAKRMLKQKTISNSNSISILGIPSNDSRHNGKCNICAFHEEIHAFEDWIFVRLSSLVLASEWTTNRNKFIV